MNLKINCVPPSNLHKYILFSLGPISIHAISNKQVGQPRKYLQWLFFLSGHIQWLLTLPFESPHIPLLSILTATSQQPHNLLSILTSVLNSSNPFSPLHCSQSHLSKSKYFTRVFLIQIFFLQRLSQSLQFSFFHSPQCDLHSWIWAALAFSEYTTLLYHMPSAWNAFNSCLFGEL